MESNTARESKTESTSRDSRSVVPPISEDAAPVLNKEEEFIEADFMTVELCKNFMRDFNDTSKNILVNPFSGRKIKRGKGMFSSVYSSTVKYLQNLDDEEFHSPIKNVAIKVDTILSKQDDSQTSCSLVEMNKDAVIEEWTERAKLNYKTYLKSLSDERSKQDMTEKIRWRNDILIVPDSERGARSELSFNAATGSSSSLSFEKRKTEWAMKYPEIFSFLDTFKPQVLENQFLMEHVFIYDDRPEYFINYLKNTAQVFLEKHYDHAPIRPVPEKRYAASIILFWIYSDFITDTRNFLKKQSNKLTDFLKTRKCNPVFKKATLSSLALVYFIYKTPPENFLNPNYEDLFNQFLSWSIRHEVWSKSYYRNSFLDYLSCRVKPFRYIKITFDDFENFEEIVKFISNPLPEEENKEDII